MNEFSAVSAEQLEEVDGGTFMQLPLLASEIYRNVTSDGEVLPGFNKFLAETRRIAGKA
jgi:hypothetical protein